jgi:anti-sigma-K factor RskA
MIANNHIDQEDLTVYALQFLSGPEAEAIRAHLDECSGCSQNIALIRGELAALALSAEIQTPPPVARQRLLTQVSREKKVIPINTAVAETSSPSGTRLLYTDEDVPLRSSTPRILPWVSWVGWAVAAGVTVMATDLYRERDELRSAIANEAHEMSAMSADAQRGRALMSALTDQGAMRVTLSRTPAKAVPQGRASYLPDKGSLIFIASNLDQLQPFKTYELWLIPADGHEPIPAGTFNPDAQGNASVIMPQIPKGVVAKAFGVTIEDEGGSRVPTLPIILSGE